VQSSASRQPQSQRLRQLADSLHAIMSRYGYLRVETPIIQPADLFLTRAGDQIVSRLFTFERGGQSLALRPEFTATAARDYATGAANGKTVVRWQFSGPIFEDDPSHASANYQRFSIGAELIGLGGTLADAEIINMALQGIAEQDIQDWQLIIGHVGLMRLLLARFNLDPRTERFLLSHLYALKDPALGKAFVIERLEKLTQGHYDNGVELSAGASAESDTQQILDALLDATQRNITMGGRTRHDIVRRLLQKRQRATEYGHILRALDFLERWSQIDTPAQGAFETIRALIGTDDAEAQAVLDAWQHVLDLLDACAVPTSRIQIQPGLARNWDYYTGIVFEIYSGDGLHLAGGGRYDELISLVGGTRSVPAVGFVYYPAPLLAAMPHEQASGDSDIVLAADEKAQAQALRWAQALRRFNRTVLVLPADHPDAAAGDTLYVKPDGTITFGGQSYSLDSIDALIARLK
jgi:ATP phosphoribosyltransferase regulatory subunit HisZ